MIEIFSKVLSENLFFKIDVNIKIVFRVIVLVFNNLITSIFILAYSTALSINNKFRNYI